MPGWKNPHFLSAWKRRILINFHCYAPLHLHRFEFESFQGGVWTHSEFQLPGFCCFCFASWFQWNVEACLAWAVFLLHPWQVQFAYHDSCIALCGEGTTEIVEILQREVGSSWCGTSDKLGGEKSVQAGQERNFEDDKIFLKNTT